MMSFSSHLNLHTCLLLSLLFCNGSSQAAQENDQTQNKLNEVQQAIAAQQSKISAANDQRATLNEQLKKDELAIAAVAGALQKTRQQLAQTTAAIAELTEQQQKLEQQLQQQEQLLGEQLRTAYSSGQHDYLKLILNQQHPATIQRTVTYYHYLNEARIGEIEHFQKTLTELNEIKAEKQQQQRQQQQLSEQQQQQQQQLAQSKQNREKTLTALSQQLRSDQQKLQQLKAEEDNLVQALEQLARAAQAEIDLTGLAKLKHKLNWPTKGRLARHFGSQKQGYLRWKGVLISAPVGKEVKAIHNGKVLFADWLNGYGLVTVIDHGAGYMSLYGHNQTLLKQVGERVETGEPIALVGQSGGQDNGGLYFEIRYQGKAQNPQTWCQ